MYDVHCTSYAYTVLVSSIRYIYYLLYIYIYICVCMCVCSEVYMHTCSMPDLYDFGHHSETKSSAEMGQTKNNQIRLPPLGALGSLQ